MVHAKGLQWWTFGQMVICILWTGLRGAIKSLREGVLRAARTPDPVGDFFLIKF
jgi:hypothetical protein